MHPNKEHGVTGTSTSTFDFLPYDAYTWYV